MSHIFQRLFFKKRTLFSIHRQEYKPQNLIHDNFEIRIYSKPKNLDAKLRDYLYKKTKRNIIEKRLFDDECVLAVAIKKDNQHPTGYCWVLGSRDSILYHDSFFIPKGSALVFNAYIEPEYRRKGVYRLLQAGLHDYMFQFPWCERVFTIVENQNLPALSASMKFGLKKYSFNYLVKVLGRNVFSIYKLNGKFLVKYICKKQ